MKPGLLKRLIFGLFILFLPVNSMAWGTEGHRIAGLIAESYLTPKAKAAIRDILGNTSIAIAGNWADLIKSDPNYAYLNAWHYIDLDKSYTYSELQDHLKQDAAVDAYTKLNFLIIELKKKSLAHNKKLLYLRMLIHIVEDMHQPMHVGHTFDKGGNDIKLTWMGYPSNLHAVWDSGLIDFQRLSYTEYAKTINFTTAAQRAQWQKEPISEWIFESSRIAGKLYTEVRSGDSIDARKYDIKHKAILNRQLLKAGVRLAGVLNLIFG